jgi:hypothetical protein
MLRRLILGLRYINAIITAKSQEFWAKVIRFYGTVFASHRQWYDEYRRYSSTLFLRLYIQIRQDIKL